MKIALFFILITFSFQTLSAQLSLKKIKATDGLSSNAIYGVFKDKRDFIWIYSIDGLNRYDGYQIRQYLSSTTNPNSIASNLIHTAFEDSKDTLWFGTQEGLSRYNSELDSFKNYKSTEGVSHTLCHDRGLKSNGTKSHSKDSAHQNFD